MEEASFESLPAEAVLSIFADLKDARSIATLAPVCRRWQSLSRYVDSLHFMLAQQSDANAVAPMLRRAHSIKNLAIEIHQGCDIPEELLSSWIEIVKDSIQDLELWYVSTKELNLWNLVKNCSKLSALRVHGSIAFLLPMLNFDLTTLRECVLDDSSFKHPAVVSVLNHCPALDKLVVKNFQTAKVRLTNSNVNSVHLAVDRREGPETGPPFIMLETMNLKCLTLDGISCVLVAPELRELHLPSRCKDLIVVSLDNVEILTMGGSEWEFKEIHSIVELVPNISEVKIDVSVSDPEPVAWKTFFNGLSRLDTITFGGNMLECFCKEIDGDVLAKLKLVKATVFLEENGCFELLEALLVHCPGLKVLTVNCSRLLQDSEEWNLMELFEARHPQMYNDLKRLQASSSRLVITLQ
ncbi:hypothetical protein SELMODRAFT_415681 [Selaginella moellendorffii]|uniref:F-box domain-containing protein n=1 Tax=Selaginella moellendorffii TaxID=88036 RepID=D8RWW9_SELML|nr:uncharacterized protein LOC9630061 [Selaginella moellendorffii]EFJ23331.1 hypothetical protein SELMODRAFT_415681 [Selaginella moellendorffii]|eukprot:XP_002975702.1 uncharacterized protein LOC9630061 [Selaginella moellendorffii]